MFCFGALLGLLFALEGKVVLGAANVTKCSTGCFLGLVIRRDFGASPWRSVLVMTEKFIFLLGVAVIFHFNLFSD